jgi:hypothetical protein
MYFNIALVFRKTILRNICVTIDHGSAPIMISLVDGWSDQGSYWTKGSSETDRHYNDQKEKDKLSNNDL